MLSPDDNYLRDAFDCTRIIIVKTILGFLKIVEDQKETIDSLFNIGFQYMLERKWKVSKCVFYDLMQLGGQTEVELYRDRVNYFISCKNLGGLECVREVIEKIDISLMAPELAIAKSALLDNHDAVSAILESIIGKELPVTAIKTWPLFIQYRESESYKAFRERHLDLFDIETHSADDIPRVTDQLDSEHGVI